MATITFASEQAYMDCLDAAQRMQDAIWEVSEPGAARLVAINDFMSRVFAEHQPETIKAYPATVRFPRKLVAMARDVLGEMVLPGSAGEVAMLSDGGGVTLDAPHKHQWSHATEDDAIERCAICGAER